MTLRSDKKAIYGRAPTSFNSDHMKVVNNEGAEDIARRLGRGKCLRIVLPEGINDVNELKVNEKENFVTVFSKLLSHAKEFRTPNILTPAETLNLFDEGKESFPFTPWHDVNEEMGKVHPGHLVVISALPKQGKSSFAENILHHNITRYDEVGLYYCIEMNPREILRRYFTIHFGKSLPSRDEQVELSNELTENGRLLLGFNETRLTVEVVLETIREAIKRYGITVVVFDHLHILIRNVQKQSVDEAVSNFMREIKLLAMELQVKFILIAQPKMKHDPDDYLTSQDIKYGGSVYSDCDCLILLQRKAIRQEGKGALSKEVIVRVEGSRYSAGGQTKLVFEGDIMKFREGVTDDSRDTGLAL